jgi:hypothetical protein
MRSRHLLFVSLIAVAILLCASAVAAQNTTHFKSDATLHGVPPSVTSFGFGGNHGFHGVPASVTSPHFGSIPMRHHPVFDSGQHHRHNRVLANPFYGGTYYAPYAYPGYVMDPGVDDSMETDYAAPMNSDREGPDPREEARHELDSLRSTVEDYRSELRSSRQRDNAEAKQAAETRPDVDQPPPADQPKTVLVFRDGHQLEVANYAIVGGMLYDLSEGRTKKVELAALDLRATVKQNDQRGVEFQLPVGAKLN